MADAPRGKVHFVEALASGGVRVHQETDEGTRTTDFCTTDFSRGEALDLLEKLAFALNFGLVSRREPGRRRA